MDNLKRTASEHGPRSEAITPESANDEESCFVVFNDPDHIKNRILTLGWEIMKLRATEPLRPHDAQ